jgi:hypothetical protein
VLLLLLLPALLPTLTRLRCVLEESDEEVMDLSFLSGLLNLRELEVSNNKGSMSDEHLAAVLLPALRQCAGRLTRIELRDCALSDAHMAEIKTWTNGELIAS